MSYDKFIKSKELIIDDIGIVPTNINDGLFDFQKDCVLWAIKKGRATLAQSPGLGKTFQQLEWSQQYIEKTNKTGLIVAPLAVSRQTKLEGEKFGYDVNICRSQSDIKKDKINITNYEKLDKFDPQKIYSLVLDESSILKSFSGKIRNQIVDSFRHVKYKLFCTATPSPNDYMELGNHAEALGIMSYYEMLSMFFVHDGGETAKWRIKGHARDIPFWKWLCSWMVMMNLPSDLGYEDNDFILPELNVINHIIKTDLKIGRRGLVRIQTDLKQRQQARRETIKQRSEKAAEIINNHKNKDEQWILWCNLNDESKALKQAIKGSIEISGADKDERKEEVATEFAKGNIKILITKPKIFGFGMNWQSCNNEIFVGLSDSWEQYYQALRRCWRFGQKKSVTAHIVTADVEGPVLKNIQRKEKQAQEMFKNIIGFTKEISRQNIKQTKKETIGYKPEIKMELPKWI